MAPLFVPVAIYDDFMCPVVQKRPRLSMPTGLVCRRPRYQDPFSSIMRELMSKPTEKFLNGKDGFEAHIDLSGFEGKDVKVKMDKKSKLVKVSAKREEEKNGCKTVRNVQRCFALPKDVKEDSVKSELGPDGVLKITCQKNEALENKQQESLEQDRTTSNDSNETSMDVDEEQKQNEDKGKENKENEEGKEKDKEENDQEMTVEVAIVNEDSNNKEKDEEKLQEMAVEVQVANKEEDIQIVHEEPKNVQVEKPFEFTVNVKYFNPDNLTVDLNMDEKMIIVKASEEEQQEDGSVVTKNLTKKMSIDMEAFDVDQIISELDENGILKISAPRRKNVQQNISRNIPINQMS